MRVSHNFINKIWEQNDQYFQFQYEEFRTFGARLKKWRELNGISQKEMAEAIYSCRKKLGLENDDISNEKLKETYTSTTEYLPIDYEILEKRTQKRNRRISSLLKTYLEWEKKETTSSLADTPFSMTHLRILKEILDCDYEFLFCEIDTPHKYTNHLVHQTGLNISTIEKLLSLNTMYNISSKDSNPSATFAHSIIVALDKLIADDDLMAYLSYYLTYTPKRYDDEKKPIFIGHSVSKSDTYEIDTENIHLIYLITIANKLQNLKEKEHTITPVYPDNLPSFTQVFLAKENDSFGERLRKWREYKHYTQDTVANLIYSYRRENNLEKVVKGISYMPEKESILRTYQNWESKSKNTKNTRLSMSDLYILKNIMECDYEYLFGEINTLNTSDNSIQKALGFSTTTLNKLEKYSKSLQTADSTVPPYAYKILLSIYLIVSDNTLLYNLTHFLLDIPFHVYMDTCPILKPVEITGHSCTLSDSAYTNYLFPENKELHNVFLPVLFNRLKEIRKNFSNNNNLSI